ncbi:MAG TPA: hypothetical protein VHE35_17600, partial [Kofleriaceae bacterium]|nr:hypothetical protein [Kofleriaceae bacterium]
MTQLLAWTRGAVAAALLGACGFSPAGAPGRDDGGGDDDLDAAAGDARVSDARAGVDAAAGPDIVYLDPANESPGTGDWVLDGPVNLNTDLDPGNPRIPGLPAGVTFTLQPQGAQNARTILVLHVHAFELHDGAELGLDGTRPLAIVAGDDVIVDGEINASAGGGAPGPGGFA